MAAPALGVYSGTARDVTCPGDHITYKVILDDGGKCTVECIPQLSYFKGGQPPWEAQGKWEVKAEAVHIDITKADVMGPRKDTDLQLPLERSQRNGVVLKFRDTPCRWAGPVPGTDPLEAKARLARQEAEEQVRMAEQVRQELEAQREALAVAQSRQAEETAAQIEEARRANEEAEQALQEQVRAAREAEELFEQQQQALMEEQAKHQAEVAAKSEEAQRMKEATEAAALEHARLAKERELALEQQREQLRELQAQQEAEARMAKEQTEEALEEQARLASEAEAEFEQQKEALREAREQQEAAVAAQREELRRIRSEMEAQKEAQEMQIQREKEELLEEQERRRRELDEAMEEEKLHQEMLQKASVESHGIMVKDLFQKAEMLAEQEANLQKDRQLLASSRGQLAMVQAHVMNLLAAQGSSGAETHQLEGEDIAGGDEGSPQEGGSSDAMGATAGGEDIWDADWAKHVHDTPPTSPGS